MLDYIIGAVILLIIGCAIWYVVKAKKSGKKCIGCPEGGHCENCSGTCGSKMPEEK